MVPVSAVAAMGFRLDTQPYIEAGFETPESMRVKAKAAARRAYFKRARRELAHIHAVERWNREKLLDGVRRLG